MFTVRASFARPRGCPMGQGEPRRGRVCFLVALSSLLPEQPLLSFCCGLPASASGLCLTGLSGQLKLPPRTYRGLQYGGPWRSSGRSTRSGPFMAQGLRRTRPTAQRHPRDSGGHKLMFPTSRFFRILPAPVHVLTLYANSGIYALPVFHMPTSVSISFRATARRAFPSCTPSWMSVSYRRRYLL